LKLFGKGYVAQPPHNLLGRCDGDTQPAGGRDGDCLAAGRPFCAAAVLTLQGDCATARSRQELLAASGDGHHHDLRRGTLQVPEGEVLVDNELATPGGSHLGGRRLKPREGQSKIIAGFRNRGGGACGKKPSSAVPVYQGSGRAWLPYRPPRNRRRPSKASRLAARSSVPASTKSRLWT